MPTPRALLIVAFLTQAATAGADPLPAASVPAPLRPWIAWVLHGEEAAGCPTLEKPDGTAGERDCFWPARLELDLTARGGRFSQSVRAFGPGWVALPGDGAHWPLDVKVDGKPVATVARESAKVPSVRLAAGDHTLTGTFAWDALPESLEVPPSTGMVDLKLSGRAIAFPARESSGSLWLQREAGGDEGQSRLEVTVHRRVTDEIPLQVVTRVKLDVSGKNREVVLGRALLEGFLPMALSSQLPARLEPDGKLRVQVRPGSWTLDVTARHHGPTTELKLGDAGGPWATEEVWVFDARPDLRVAMPTGVPAVDASQTTLPAQWRALPAYRVRPGDTLKLVVERRGDADPAPDRLTLHRTLWLDFDGDGYSLRDELSGRLTRSWRLALPRPIELGRVAVDGKDQLITRLDAKGPAGVEIRQGQLRLTADSRLESGGSHDLPAVGWDNDLHQLSAELRLPPGWRLIHAGGVDSCSETWLHQWSLLHLFLLLIVALATGRLFGWAWGGVALLGLVLAIPESAAPRWMWALPLACEALVRVLRHHKMARVSRVVRFCSWITLALLLIPFAVEHVREGLHPVIDGRATLDSGDGIDQVQMQERSLRLSLPSSGESNEPETVNGTVPDTSNTESAGNKAQDFDREGKEDSRGMAGKMAPKKKQKEGGSRGWSSYKQKIDLAQIDPGANVQTGPGLPAWSWHSVSLRWSGPVERDQRLRLWLLSPRVNLVLAFLRVALLALLFLRIVGAVKPRGLPGDGDEDEGPPLPPSPLPVLGGPPAVVLALLLGAGLLLGRTAHAQDLPDKELLDELRTRLLEKPECAPGCAASPRLSLEDPSGTLRLRVEIGAAAAVAVPLPGGLDHWTPERILVDGQPAKALRRTADGVLWIALGPGLHQIVLEGALPEREAVQIPLPLKPHHATAISTAWRLDGLHDDGAVDDTLQLTRVHRSGEAARLDQGTLPPFVQVQRDVLLGLTWQVETRVTRLTPPGAPVVLEIPLLVGESVTTAGVHVEGGKATVNMSPTATEVTWRSVLSERPRLELAAPDVTSWTEVWHVELGQIWHIDVTGIPPVHREAGPARIPEWRPWPGEKVNIAVTRPGAVPGRTLTIQASQLELQPGVRATDAALTLSLTASRGGQHTVTLPEGAQLQSVAIDGTARPIRQEGRKVTFPVAPGSAKVRLDWRQPGGIALFFHSPDVDLGAPHVNSRITLELPRDRWMLLAGGKPVGPAVLFWSLLFVVLLTSALLGRIHTTPLRTHHWALLGLGLTQVPITAAALVAGWILLLGWRQRRGDALPGRLRFDALQLTILAATIASTVILFLSIRAGLLGAPAMQVAGNGSSGSSLRWFLDRASGSLPRVWVLSVPLLFYRLAMLAWALWLAVMLTRWLRWAWRCFSTGGLWRPIFVKKPSPPPPATPPPPAAV